jgi:catechol 2,3-dioxygenase-like lactoylglutathione lyase family enzyme
VGAREKSKEKHMALEVLELHHHAVRMPMGKVAEMGAFYGDVLGLDTDRGRWEIPGIAGYFLDMGNDCQIHLLGSDGPSPYAQGPGRDPVENHVALAVRDIAAAQAELERLGVDFWKLDNVAAPELMQLFLRDPVGNLIELHQIGRCRCKRSDRAFADARAAEGAAPSEARA